MSPILDGVLWALGSNQYGVFRYPFLRGKQKNQNRFFKRTDFARGAVL